MIDIYTITEAMAQHGITYGESIVRKWEKNISSKIEDDGSVKGARKERWQVRGEAGKWDAVKVNARECFKKRAHK